MFDRLLNEARESGEARFWDVCSRIRCRLRSLRPSLLGILKVGHFQGNVGRILAQASVSARSLVVRGAVQGGAPEDGVGFHVCCTGWIEITVLGLSASFQSQHLHSLFYKHTSETARYSE